MITGFAMTSVLGDFLLNVESIKILARKTVA